MQFPSETAFDGSFSLDDNVRCANASARHAKTACLYDAHRNGSSIKTNGDNGFLLPEAMTFQFMQAMKFWYFQERYKAKITLEMHYFNNT